MSLFAEIEKTIERAFRSWTESAFGRARSSDLVVLHRAILEEVLGKVEVMGRGQRVFPFAHVAITIVGETVARREILRAGFSKRLPTDILAALRTTRCEIPVGFAVTVDVAESGLQPVEIEYFAEPPTQETEGPGRLILVKGKAEPSELTLVKARTNIGRLRELVSSTQRVLRRNDIAFEDDSDEINATVSRKHAHIELQKGEYRVCDDDSEFGTTIFRDGRPIELFRGGRRGEKLRAGDEIYFGRACMRFER